MVYNRCSVNIWCAINSCHPALGVHRRYSRLLVSLYSRYTGQETWEGTFQLLLCYLSCLGPQELAAVRGLVGGDLGPDSFQGSFIHMPWLGDSKSKTGNQCADNMASPCGLASSQLGGPHGVQLMRWLRALSVSIITSKRSLHIYLL